MDDRPLQQPDSNQARAVAGAEQDPDVEPRLSPRERAAGRALRAAVFGMVFVPLLVYAAALLLRISGSRARLIGAPRRQAVWAAVIVLALPAMAAVFFLAYFLVPSHAEIDLRDYPHPAELVGTWIGTIQDPDGERRIELKLRPDATMRYRETGAGEVDGRGYWAYAENRLFLQVTRSAKGAEIWLGRIVGWNSHMPNDDQLQFGECVLDRTSSR